MNPGKGLVLDANILLRAVLNLVEGYRPRNRSLHCGGALPAPEATLDRPPLTKPQFAPCLRFGAVQTKPPDRNHSAPDRPGKAVGVGAGLDVADDFRCLQINDRHVVIR